MVIQMAFVGIYFISEFISLFILELLSLSEYSPVGLPTPTPGGVIRHLFLSWCVSTTPV